MWLMVYCVIWKEHFITFIIIIIIIIIGGAVLSP
jgi:hypothetical protein